MQELHLSLTQSNWRYGVWGEGIPRTISPVGAQLVTWLAADRDGASRSEDTSYNYIRKLLNNNEYLNIRFQV